MDTNKIAKGMTREEFLQSDYLFEKDNEDCFMSYKCTKNELAINNIEKLECEKTIPFSCEKCWENAIKDIKFKGENGMGFDWEGFRNNEFVVLCNTEEKAEDFLKECYKKGMYWASSKTTALFKYCKDNDTCYSYNFNDNNHIQYSRKSFYLDKGYKVIEWKIENKIDCDREYNIMEIKEFPEGTEFIDGLCLKIRFNNNCMEVLSNKTKKWTECKITKNWLNSKFKIVKRDKKVSFKEAIQAYENGKAVKCILNNEIYFYYGSYAPKDIKNYGEYFIKYNENAEDNSDFPTTGEILRGEWYVKED